LNLIPEKHIILATTYFPPCLTISSGLKSTNSAAPLPLTGPLLIISLE